MSKPAHKSGERGPYAGGVARREAILDATVDMIAEVGYHGLSMRDVARRVGISHPGVIYHFPSKEALLMAVIELYEDRSNFDVQAMRHMQPFEVFNAFTELSTELSSNPTIVEMECMLSVEASNEVHPAHDHFAARFEGLQSVLTSAFSQLQTDDLINKDADPKTLAHSLLAEWYGLHIQWLYNRDGVDVVGSLTNLIINQVDLSNPKALRAIMSSGFATPSAMAAIEQVAGFTLEDLLEKGYISLSSQEMEKYGLSDVPEDILDKIVRSGILNANDLEYAQENQALSIDLLGRLVINSVLETEEYNTLADVGVVPREAVAALTAVMAARPF